MEMRIYDRDFQRSDTEMRLMLYKAALEEHGFKLEISSKLMTEAGSDEPVYQKRHYYYKEVDCSQVPEVNELVESLIPGKKKKKQFISEDSKNSDAHCTSLVFLRMSRTHFGLHIKN